MIRFIPKFQINAIIFLVTLLCLSSCMKPKEDFIGKWQILTVVEDNESIDLPENWIELKSDGTFESYDGELKKSERGTWKYDPKTRDLFINGEGDSEDSSWRLQMKNDTLFLPLPLRSPT